MDGTLSVCRRRDGGPPFFLKPVSRPLKFGKESVLPVSLFYG